MRGNPNILPGGCFDEPAHGVAHSAQALAALQHLPENPDTMRQAIDLRLTVRVVLHPLSAFTQILPHLRAAKRLAEALGDSRRLEIFSPRSLSEKKVIEK